MIDLGDRAVEGNDFEAMVGGVHDQVLAHDGQANEAEISTDGRWHRRADIDAGQSRSKVSQDIGSIQLCMTYVANIMVVITKVVRGFAIKRKTLTNNQVLGRKHSCREQKEMTMSETYVGWDIFERRSFFSTLLGSRAAQWFLEV
jgi:hypothetical protein